MKFTFHFAKSALRRPMLYLSSLFVLGSLSQFVTAYDLSYAYTLSEAFISLMPMILMFSLGLYGVVIELRHAFYEAVSSRDMEIFLALEMLGKKKLASNYALSRFAS